VCTHDAGARRHGRATFSVLLFQDLAVVVLLMLIPLLAPDPTGASGGIAKIAQVRFGVSASSAAVAEQPSAALRMPCHRPATSAALA
jgi:Kef-type K+ transport system membrane component KefB